MRRVAPCITSNQSGASSTASSGLLHLEMVEVRLAEEPAARVAPHVLPPRLLADRRTRVRLGQLRRQRLGEVALRSGTPFAAAAALLPRGAVDSSSVAFAPTPNRGTTAFGGAIGVMFYLAYAVGSAFYAIGFAEELRDSLPHGSYIHRACYNEDTTPLQLWATQCADHGMLEMDSAGAEHAPSIPGTIRTGLLGPTMARLSPLRRVPRGGDHTRRAEPADSVQCRNAHAPPGVLRQGRRGNPDVEHHPRCPKASHSSRHHRRAQCCS